MEVVYKYYRYFISITYCSNDLELFSNIGLPSSVTDLKVVKVHQYYSFLLALHIDQMILNYSVI